jgi:hypothetical protein
VLGPRFSQWIADILQFAAAQDREFDCTDQVEVTGTGNLLVASAWTAWRS